MTNNDILRRLRYALNRNDLALAEITSKSGRETSEAEVAGWLKQEGTPGFVDLTDRDLCSILDGLIVEKRGPNPSGNVAVPQEYLSNNEILKKLRIAWNLKSDDMIAVFGKAEFSVSSAELGAYSRRPSHPKYVKCPEKVLRKFIKGLSVE